MSANLLHYRGWKGTTYRPFWAIWPIARVALANLFRRPVFWVLYGFGLFIFLMFFFGGYLLDWAMMQMSTGQVEFGARTDRMIQGLRKAIAALNGSNETFVYFFVYQGAMLMVTLAMTGATLVGNDYVKGSVAFYLSKPISRWHYIIGKCLAVGTVVNMLTTLPALFLFAQHGLGDWDYLTDPEYFGSGDRASPAGFRLLAGLLAYGLLITVVLSIVLVTVASWVQKSMPLIMIWATIFLFLRMVSEFLVEGVYLSEHWRLLDVWNSTKLVGCWLLGKPHDTIRPRGQPPTWEAALVLLVVCTLCLIYLNRRTRAIQLVK
ncbi:MAG: ABC transporter permease subunit [Gemmataceae bacterium]